MRKPLLIIIIGLLFPALDYAQSIPSRNISYSYDATGNRTQRMQLALGTTCRKGSDTPQKDSLAGASIVLYPNPTKNTLTVTIDSNPEGVPVELRLFSLTGTQMQYIPALRGSTTLSLGGYTAGTYLLKLRRGAKETVWRIVKVD
jgi:hypothetical protein